MFVFPYNISQTHIFFSLTQPSYPLPFLGTEFGFAQTRWTIVFSPGSEGSPAFTAKGHNSAHGLGLENCCCPVKLLMGALSLWQLKQSLCSHTIFRKQHVFFFSNSTFLSTSFPWNWVWICPDLLKLWCFLWASVGSHAFTAKRHNSAHGLGLENCFCPMELLMGVLPLWQGSVV